MIVSYTVGEVHPSQLTRLLSLVAQAGFEPTKADAHRLPGPERLPFRHCAAYEICSQSSRALAPNRGPAALLLTQCINPSFQTLYAPLVCANSECTRKTLRHIFDANSRIFIPDTPNHIGKPSLTLCQYLVRRTTHRLKTTAIKLMGGTTCLVFHRQWKLGLMRLFVNQGRTMSDQFIQARQSASKFGGFFPVQRNPAFEFGHKVHISAPNQPWNGVIIYPQIVIIKWIYG